MYSQALTHKLKKNEYTVLKNACQLNFRFRQAQPQLIDPRTGRSPGQAERQFLGCAQQGAALDPQTPSLVASHHPACG